ncbi:putative nucleotide-sugar transporter [Lyophyllum shimeji]|uniref:Nucleotide-sugar transporter n=1 Tax=Lyophyllum shimeji TaxID=47721 RepID=A0A9P3UL90_LYOSH|nr:putative nucleotide-sugar transporter [Lyophyllum shimeji]
MPSSFYVPFLLGGMILTGSSNSLWSKWQDMQCVENCADPDPTKQVLYEQPVWQTLQMFLGEMLCFLPVLYTWLATYRQSSSVHLPPDSEHDPHVAVKLGTSSKHLTGAKVLLFWIPALCDLTGTTLMNVGLLYTPVSIYQMTRGALVLFVGVLSVMFLRRRLWLYQWISLIVVMTGVGLVGYSGSLIKDAIKESPLPSLTGHHNSTELPPPEQIEQPEMTKVLVGVFFILFAQVFTATQFVVEEKIMARYTVTPLLAVGYEGLFGTISILLLIPIMAIPSVSKISPFFDLPRGWHQLVDNAPVLWSGIAIAFSIAFFNYFGLSVTRHVSATARSLTDTCRTLSIWLISLGLGWEHFLFPTSLLQVLGFSLLVYGTFLFNNLVAVPSCIPGPPPASSPVRIVDEEEDEADALLSSSILDETAALPADLGQSGFDVLPEGQPKSHAHAFHEQPLPQQPPKTTASE